MKSLLFVFSALFLLHAASAQDTSRNSARSAYRVLMRRQATPVATPASSTTPAPDNKPVPQPAAPQPAAPQPVRREEAPANNASAPSGKNIVKNIDNGISFTVTGCTGNPHEQTVTLYFTFSNPNKVHQLITLRFRKYGNYTNALDRESNAYTAGEIILGGESNSDAYRQSVKQLPTGNILKGAITFTNILPSVTQFSLINILTESCNSSGGGDKKEGWIEVQNVPVTWAAAN